MQREEIAPAVVEEDWEAKIERVLYNIERRLIRIETKLSQAMLHIGMDPHTQMYDNTPNPTAVEIFGPK